MQRRLEPGDWVGPLWSLWASSDASFEGRPITPVTYRVIDRCEHSDLLAAWSDASEWGTLLPEFGTSAWERDPVERKLERCTSVRYLALVESFGTPVDGRHAATSEAAWAWLESRRSEETGSEFLPNGAELLGSTDSWSWAGHGGHLGIVFSPADAPVDEVRVLPDTVAVRDGMLRGLMRNWSRHLWAYEVNVTVDEHTFVWPLSIQPGETAPFEIHGWDGSADPGGAEIEIEADLSWHADPSRAFQVISSHVRLKVGASERRVLPSEVRKRFAQVVQDVAPSTTSRGTLEWTSVDLVVPRSHPSLAADVGGLATDDLRGYGALLDRSGRVVDVGPAVVGHAYLRSAEPRDDSRSRARGWEEVSSLPLRDLDARALRYELRLDVHAAWPEHDAAESLPARFPSDLQIWPENGDWEWHRIEGGYACWIGAAHPWRASG